MEPIVAFLFLTVCSFIVLFPTIAFFAYILLILLPSVLFFWLYLNYFHGIMPIELVTNFILLSVLLITFPFLLFQIIAVTLGLLIIKKLKNQQNHAFLLTKSAVSTFGKRLITYRKIFLFFFLAYRKRIFYFAIQQWPLFVSIFTLFVTVTFLNTLKTIEVESLSKIAQIENITDRLASHNFFVCGKPFRKGRATKNSFSIFHQRRSGIRQKYLVMI